MSHSPGNTRREDAWTAAIVQYGLALRTVIGVAGAQRYLISRCVPLHIVERVLSAQVDAHRAPTQSRLNA